MAKKKPDGEPRLERLPSGIPGMDTVLRGGFLTGGVFIVQGDPGAGKTILGNQICFNRAAAGERAVYVTLLAESHARMLQHIGHLDFFDQSAIPEKVYYISAFRTLEEEGLAGVINLVGREVQAHQATVLVLDGLIAVEETATTPREFKKFVHELQAQSSITGCTIFALTSPPEREVPPEHTMVDGVIDLQSSLYGRRAERALHVLKMRGGGFMRGQHSFRITDEGIVVYPRTEAWLASPSAEDRIDGPPVPTGMKAFDEMAGGGLPYHSTSLLVGPAGAGKTTFCLHFLGECSKDEPGLYFGLYEPPAAILVKAKALGLPLEKLIGRGHVELLWQPATEGVLDEVCHRLVEAVKRRGVRRLVIDGIGGFEQLATDRDRLPPIYTAFCNEFRALGLTSIHTIEADVGGVFSRSLSSVTLNGLSGIAENVFLMRFIERRSRVHRLVSVVKVRDSDIDTSLREYSITKKGIRVAPDATSAEAILAEVTGKAGGGRNPVVPPKRTRRRPRPEK